MCKNTITWAAMWAASSFDHRGAGVVAGLQWLWADSTCDRRGTGW
jgi:hypothetical protein